MRTCLNSILPPATVLAAVLLAAAPAAPAGAEEVPADLKVAMFADQGPRPGAEAVLRLVKSEGADLVVHQGDFDYRNQPLEWDRQFSDILGEDFPLFAAFGNEERHMPDAYGKLLAARLARTPGADCDGRPGVRITCRYRGLFIVTMAAGLRQFGPVGEYAEYAEKQLEHAPSRWRICSFHKPRAPLSRGEKKSAGLSGGYPVHEACRRGGALILHGHGHFYMRTHLIEEFGSDLRVAAKGNVLEIAPGRTVQIISGLGGAGSPRGTWDRDWIAVYQGRSTGVKLGALFCVFNPGGAAPDRADCEFKEVGGAVHDRFTLISRVRPADD